MSRFVRTYKRRKAFLDSLAVGDSESAAARAADGTVSNFRAWKNSDAEFAKDVEDAIEEGTDFIEDVATDRAIKKSDPLMAMILRARRPDKYDRGSKLELSGSLNVEGSKAKLLNRIARLQAEGALLQGGAKEESEASSDKSEEGSKAEAPKLLPAPGSSPVPERGRKRRAAEQPDRRKAASA